MVDKTVPLLPVAPLVAPVIQINPQQRPHGLRVAQQKVHVLAVDLVGVGPESAVVLHFGIKQVPQRDLGED